MIQWLLGGRSGRDLCRARLRLGGEALQEVIESAKQWTRSEQGLLTIGGYVSGIAQTSIALGPPTEEVHALVEDTLDIVRRTGQLTYEADLLRLRGEILLLKEPKSEMSAQECFEAAIASSRACNSKSSELRATICLARLLRDTNRRDEARAMRSDIYNWFTEGFDNADLKDAKALLDELAS